MLSHALSYHLAHPTSPFVLYLKHIPSYVTEIFVVRFGNTRVFHMKHRGCVSSAMFCKPQFRLFYNSGMFSLDETEKFLGIRATPRKK